MIPNRNLGLTPRVFLRNSKTPVLFGVKWDMESPQIRNAIVADIIAYNRLVPNGCKLVVVCPDFGYLSGICSALGIDVTSDPELVKKCEIWKLYYVHEVPDMPPNGKHVYSKKVNGEGRVKLVLREGRPAYPSLYNPNDNIIVPPAKSPNINKIPPRYYGNMPQPGLPVQW